MAVVFYPEQTTTKNDLNIFIKDTNNNLFDPHEITYTIINDNEEKIFGTTLFPEKESTGYYWAKVTFPLGISLGTYKIIWKIKDFSDSNYQIVEQRFGVVKKQTTVLTSNIGGVIYYPNQILTDKDLYIIIRNQLGNMADPYLIAYEIYQRIGGLDVLISPPAQIPSKISVGQYYANYIIPYDAVPGDYYIKWAFLETPSSEEVFAVQEFAVVDSSVLIQSPYTNDTVKVLIRKLRFLLRDNNPDRNYHFMPPASEEVIQGFTQKFGYVWEDEELYEYLDVSVSDINNFPPHESWTLDTIPFRLYSMVLTHAGGLALRALAINWAHEEWSGDISGVGLQIEKSSKYMSLKENFESAYSRQIEEHKTYGVRFIRGVRQGRYNIGVTSALGPYSRSGVQARRNYIGGGISAF